MKTKKSGSGHTRQSRAGTAETAGNTARYLFNYTMLNATAQDAALYMTVSEISTRRATRRHAAGKAGQICRI